VEHRAPAGAHRDRVRFAGGPGVCRKRRPLLVNWLTSSINRLDSAEVVREEVANLATLRGESSGGFCERNVRCDDLTPITRTADGYLGSNYVRPGAISTGKGRY